MPIARSAPSVPGAAQVLSALTLSALAPETSLSLSFLQSERAVLEANAKTDFDLPVAPWFFLR
jgi:hypothetical protein